MHEIVSCAGHSRVSPRGAGDQQVASSLSWPRPSPEHDLQEGQPLHGVPVHLDPVGGLDVGQACGRVGRRQRAARSAGVQPSPAAQHSTPAHHLLWPCPLQRCKAWQPGWPRLRPLQQLGQHASPSRQMTTKGSSVKMVIPMAASPTTCRPLQAAGSASQCQVATGQDRASQRSTGIVPWQAAVAQELPARPQAAPVVEVGEGGVEAYEERPAAMGKSGNEAVITVQLTESGASSSSGTPSCSFI